MTGLATRLCAGILALFVCRHSLGDDMARGLGDDELAALGRSYAAAMNEADAEALQGLFELPALGLRVAQTLTDDEAERADFVKGFAAGAAQLAPQFIEQLQAQQGRVRYLRVRTFNGMRGPLVRYDLGEGGYNYLLLIGERAAGAEPRIVDMFIATTGQRLSATLGSVSQLMIRPSSTVLEKLFGRKIVDTGLVDTLKAAGQLQRDGDVAGAYGRIDSLPDSIRNHRVILNVSVQLASRLDEERYRTELGRLAAHHSDDPTAAFALIDHYFYHGDTDTAMSVIDGVERAFGADAAIMLMKSSIATTAGSPDQAVAYARRGIDLEPDNEQPYWGLVSALMAARNFADGTRALDAIGERFDYEFEAASFEGNEIYADFVRSREFAEWIADL